MHIKIDPATVINLKLAGATTTIIIIYISIIT